MDELRVIWPLLLIGFGKRNTTAEQPKITMGVGEAGKLQVNELTAEVKLPDNAGH